MKKSTGNLPYFYTIFATFLALIVVGLASYIGYQVHHLNQQIQENLLVEIVLKNDVTEAKAKEAIETLKQRPYTKSATFISKEMAGNQLKNEIGKDAFEVLGYNPLYASIHLFIKSSFSSKAALLKITEEIKFFEGIEKINCQYELAEEMQKISSRVVYIGLGISMVLLFFAIALIFSTIRLAIFAKRQTIRSMQLFGATRWFIMKPFLARSLLNGFLAACLAILVLAGVLYYVAYNFPDLALQQDLVIFAILSGILVFFGMFISLLSTTLALRIYLNYKLEELY